MHENYRRLIRNLRLSNENKKVSETITQLIEYTAHQPRCRWNMGGDCDCGMVELRARANEMARSIGESTLVIPEQNNEH